MATLIKYALLALFPVAIYPFWIAAFNNGFGFYLINEILPKGELPGTPGVPFKTRYTGIPFLDYILTTYTLFYWPIFNGQLPSLFVQFIPLLGLLGASLTLVLMEECRTQSFSRRIGRLTLTFTVNMFTGTAVLFTLYLALSIPSKPSWDEVILAENFVFVERIPSYLTLGYILVSILMCLPTPGVISYDFKQQMILLFELTPVLIGACVCFTWLRYQKNGQLPRPTSTAVMVWKQKSVYAFAIACSAITHFVAVLPALAVTLGYPSLYPEDGYNDLLAMFTPPALWAAAPDVNQSIFLQFQWDYVLAGMAILLWSMAHYIQGGQLAKKPVSFVGLFVKGLAQWIIIGPGGSAAVLLWRRDEMVRRYVGEGKDK